MFVYICCAGGITSSMLCEKIQKLSTEDFKIHIDPITTAVSDKKSGKLDDFDLILAYGDVGGLNNAFIKDFNLDNHLDLILISPQVKFQLGRVQKLMNPYNIPAAAIDMRDFGTMNGPKMIQTILTYKK